MEILLAEVLGFCFGVRRAIEQAESALTNGNSVYSLGPLVHNPQEIARLTALGIQQVDAVDDIGGPTVVIRAHGARPETLQSLHDRGLQIADATCPFVAKSQRIALQLNEAGYQLVIVGHPDHPEVQGILGYAHAPAFVITHPEEAATLPADIRPGVIAQTTVNEQTFLDVVAAIRARYPDAVVHDTVCSATRERQDAARKLSTIVDAMIVVGGRHSSNTNRLAEICTQRCERTYLIEKAEEIDPAWLTGIQRIGITAGASTPNWLIEQVIARLKEFE